MRKQVIQFIGVFVLLIACSSSKKAAHDTQTTWQAMDNFHMILAETFHPFMDSANLQPVKMNYKELQSAVEAWGNSTIPEKADNEVMKSKLRNLNIQVMTLADKVKSSSDDEIGQALIKVHDTFHEIQDVWYSDGGVYKKHSRH